MNRNERRLTKKQAEHKARRMMTGVHILIAVVAIIECLLLVSFTTYSWIESNSSLIIQNGPESSQILDQTTTKKMDIAKALNSTLDLKYSDDSFAPLNNFFSEVKYFEFATATSSDGRNLFFPCRNNTYSTAGKYRRGDTVDYNTSFLYFDFVMSNRNPGGTNNVENRDVYFDETTGYTDIFTVTGDDLTAEQKAALVSAMRMSITTQYGTSAPSTKIYAKTAYSGSAAYNSSTGTGTYKSIDISTGQDGTMSRNYAYDESHDPTDHDRNTWVTTYDLDKSIYHQDTTTNAIDADKLFVVKKNGETKVSFRIWFDVWDPQFRSVFGLDGLDYSSYENSEAAYWKIPNATVGIKFRLKTSGNDLRSIYFDDYTLTNQAGININHLTDEHLNDSNYKVWFYTWQPAIAANQDHPARAAGYYAIPLNRDSSDATHTLWSANTATQSEMDYLMGADIYNTTSTNASGYTGSVADRYTKSYFCYGDFSTKTAIYKWELPAKPVSDDFIFNAYSYMPNSSSNKTSHTWSGDTSGTTWWDCNGTNVKSGVGIWQDDAASSMVLLKFSDMATAVTASGYNSGDNFRIMKSAAVTDDHHKYLVYANNYNSSSSNSSTVLSENFSANVEKRTAAMYYDSVNEVFKSYVPAGWLTGNTGVSFTYCPSGIYSAIGSTLRWYSPSGDISTLSGEYVYTALGYSNAYNSSDLTGIGYTPGFYSTTGGYIKGVGTWRAVEEIKFSTDLIDNDLNASYRYFVGISDSYSAGYYVMNPDASHMTFSAYIPAEEGASSPGVNFARLNTYKLSNDGTAPAVYWYGNTRGTYGTFYPVDCTGTTTTQYTHGYWNLSVLVDGTYENLIYDTLTDGGHYNGAPLAGYSPVVTTGDAATKGSVDYSPRINYGKLEFSYNGTSWHTVCDDTTDTYSYSENGVVIAKMIDRYRFYVVAETYTTVYWRWTPYAGYTVTYYTDNDNDPTTPNVSKTVTADDTVFNYTHNVADAALSGIYLVVTEAPSV